MEKKNIDIEVVIYNHDELSDADRRLRVAAVEAASTAYAPYSRYQVGAAALLADGTIVKGCNQENAAYPSGLCAERVALFAAGAAYPDQAVEALAVTAVKDGEIAATVSPCGACRQVMLETEQRYGGALRVLLCSRDETLVAASAQDLLPFCFGKDDL